MAQPALSPMKCGFTFHLSDKGLTISPFTYREHNNIMSNVQKNHLIGLVNEHRRLNFLTQIDMTFVGLLLKRVNQYQKFNDVIIDPNMNPTDLLHYMVSNLEDLNIFVVEKSQGKTTYRKVKTGQLLTGKIEWKLEKDKNFPGVASQVLSLGEHVPGIMSFSDYLINVKTAQVHPVKYPFDIKGLDGFCVPENYQQIVDRFKQQNVDPSLFPKPFLDNNLPIIPKLTVKKGRGRKTTKTESSLIVKFDFMIGSQTLNISDIRNLPPRLFVEQPDAILIKDLTKSIFDKPIEDFVRYFIKFSGMDVDMLRTLYRRDKVACIETLLMQTDKTIWQNCLKAHQEDFLNNGWILDVDDFKPDVDIGLDDRLDIDLKQNGDWWFDIALGIQTESGEKVDFIPHIQEFLKNQNTPPTLARLKNISDKQGYIVLEAPGIKQNIRIHYRKLNEWLERILSFFNLEEIREGATHLALLTEKKGFDLLKDEFVENDFNQKLRVLKQEIPEDHYALPDGLLATLRPYQVDGYQWLNRRAELGLGGILADDMGLGKTVQVLAHILWMKQHRAENNLNQSPTLIVVPKTLLDNWVIEKNKFTPDLVHLVYHGTGRALILDNVDIVITTYGMVKNDIMVLRDVHWNGIFLDEAQNIKSVQTNSTQNVFKLKSDYRFCMTGTPIENNLKELWSLMSFSVNNILGTGPQFVKQFGNPIEKKQNQNRRDILKKWIAPFIIRRTKKDVLKDLPEKQTIDEYLTFGDEQREIYESVRASTQKQLQAIIEEKGLASSSMFVIEALLKLRQACCHTSLIKGKIAYDPYSAKMEFLENNLKEMIAQDGKIIIFSQFTSMLDLIEPLLETMNIPFIRLDGKTRNRTEKVNIFQEGDIPVFLISLKAGGVGLNITKANIVIHMDLWWNPAVEDQATDRAHRIGQTQTVMVYRLVMKDSVEEKIIALQEKKRDIASIVDMEDGQLIEGVTVNDLYDLLA